MTRMIERWFPCAEVSEASASGWGSGKSEKGLFTWFAARPLAQAKAAVITSLLTWPEDVAEQRRLQDLVRRALAGRDGAWGEIVAEIEKSNPGGASAIDIFSGRAMIPLEAARLGVETTGVDYSPVATLAGRLLADYPLRDWSDEPSIRFGDDDDVESADQIEIKTSARLVADVEIVLNEVGRRYAETMRPFYPTVDGKDPWGYVWAVTLPCRDCGRRFPLTGSLVLRHPLPLKNDPGQSYEIAVDPGSSAFAINVHDGPPRGTPTLVNIAQAGKASRGKSAVCPFCGHVHQKSVHTQMAADGLGEDALLVVADLDESVGKSFRIPTPAEYEAVAAAREALAHESRFAPGVPAVPDERIPPGNNHTVRPLLYGAQTYGDLMNDRQTLSFVRLTRAINELGLELPKMGLSPEYTAALVGYAASVIVRRIKRATRGATLDPNLRPTSNRVMMGHIFTNEASIAFSYDYFEPGIDDGPGTWNSLMGDTLAVLRNQVGRVGGLPANIIRGDATALPLPDRSVSVVVTDPPYDNMIDYSDASDLFYVWLKRALLTTQPWFAVTTHENGVQEKANEIIVKGGGNVDHRTREHYSRLISEAFAEARRVVNDDGVVTIVFGHGDPEVWHRLLGSITSADLVLTGSWPAKTESGGSAGSANIVTTLTMACRPAPSGRSSGRASAVEAEVKDEVKSRLTAWDAAGLATTDMLMASAGPAMEVVGRYSEVLDARGEPVDAARYLSVARRAVQEAQAITVDTTPLESFDRRTQFALWWIRLFGRDLAPKSEVRWQALAADLGHDDVRYLVPDSEKGARLVTAGKFKESMSTQSPVIDVAFAMAKAYPAGLDEVGAVLAAAGRDDKDEQLWGAVKWLTGVPTLPASDPDVIAWTQLLRNRGAVASAVDGVVSGMIQSDRKNRQMMIGEDMGDDE